jgi:hypothetical protein
VVGPNDLDKVGLTLLSVGDNYLIAGIVPHDGKLNVTGILGIGSSGLTG